MTDDIHQFLEKLEELLEKLEVLQKEEEKLVFKFRNLRGSGDWEKILDLLIEWQELEAKEGKVKAQIIDKLERRTETKDD